MADTPGPPYEVVVHPKAERDLNRLHPGVARRILEAALRLGTDPYPGGKKVKRIIGVEPPAYRLRVGDYRALYRVHEEGRRVYLLRVVTRADLRRGIAGLPGV